MEAVDRRESPTDNLTKRLFDNLDMLYGAQFTLWVGLQRAVADGQFEKKTKR